MVGNEVGLAAVVFDWAGTVVDFGSLAPMGAFVELFASEGVHITIEDARVPMGLPKWQHIQALGRLPRVAAAWQARHGGALTDADVDRLYERFTPMNMAAVPRHATLVEGVPALVQALRTRGLKIGSTTGYNREIMAVLAPLAAEQGFEPDNLVCAGDVSQNRPAPLGMYRTFTTRRAGADGRPGGRLLDGGDHRQRQRDRRVGRRLAGDASGRTGRPPARGHAPPGRRQPRLHDQDRGRPAAGA